jgi:hypothetical protein
MQTMYKILTFWGLVFSTQTLYAQDTTYWTKTGSAGLNLNQAQFSSNWKGGGTSSISLAVLIFGKANYRRDKVSWDNTADFAYGFMRNDMESFTRKTSDRLFLDSKYGYGLSPKWSMFGSLNFLTQFAPGYVIDSLVKSNKRVAFSNFMAPGFLTYSIGLEYVPVEYFKIRFGTGTVRHTFVLDSTVYEGEGVPVEARKRYGLKPGRRVRTEAAFQLQADFEKRVMENLTIKARYLAFVNYENLELEKIDHRLDFWLSAQVNKYISTSLTFTGLYDFDQSPDVQYSQLLGLGILYKF